MMSEAGVVRNNEGGAGARKLHAIMLSLPFQGHINPSVGLALKLASVGITVTFVNLEVVDHTLTQIHGGDFDLFAAARDAGLDTRYETMSDGLPLEYDRGLHLLEYVKWVIDELPGRVDRMVEKKMREFSGWNSFLVADSFFFWTPNVARKYGILSVSLWTQPAVVFSVLYHLQLLQQHGHFPVKDDAEEEITYLPGIPSINTKDLNYLKESEAVTVIGELLTITFREVKKADFVLHNTVEELEPEVLSALNEHQQNYAIGPINLLDSLLLPQPLSKSLWPESDCMDWLASKPPGSVIYVSFGSLIHSSKEVIDEIAYGLLLSEADFVWALRPGILAGGENYELPDGYTEKMKKKGMIIPWANQVAILSDPAIGGFLTHGGWNSTLEGVWFGVPMICYPFANDQMTNRKLVVDDWEIGVDLCGGKGVGRREVAERIRSVIGGGETLRKKMKGMSEMVRAASGVVGSSQRNFDRFVGNLVRKIGG